MYIANKYISQTMFAIWFHVCCQFEFSSLNACRTALFIHQVDYELNLCEVPEGCERAN